MLFVDDIRKLLLAVRNIAETLFEGKKPDDALVAELKRSTEFLNKVDISSLEKPIQQVQLAVHNLIILAATESPEQVSVHQAVSEVSASARGFAAGLQLAVRAMPSDDDMSSPSASNEGSRRGSTADMTEQPVKPSPLAQQQGSASKNVNQSDGNNNEDDDDEDDKNHDWRTVTMGGWARLVARELQGKRWYHSHMNRAMAEEHLMSLSPGAFVLRPSSQEKALSLSYVVSAPTRPAGQAVLHSVIRVVYDSGQSVRYVVHASTTDKPMVYDSIEKLLGNALPLKVAKKPAVAEVKPAAVAAAAAAPSTAAASPPVAAPSPTPPSSSNSAPASTTNASPASAAAAVPTPAAPAAAAAAAAPAVDPKSIKSLEEAIRTLGLRAVLEDSHWCLEYIDRCRADLNHEHPQFWLSVELYRSIKDDEARVVHASSIWDQFVCPGSPLEINVSTKMRRRIQDGLGEGPLQLFDAAQREVLNLMKGHAASLESTSSATPSNSSIATSPNRSSAPPSKVTSPPRGRRLAGNSSVTLSPAPASRGPGRLFSRRLCDYCQKVKANQKWKEETPDGKVVTRKLCKPCSDAAQQRFSTATSELMEEATSLLKNFKK